VEQQSYYYPHVRCLRNVAVIQSGYATQEFSSFFLNVTSPILGPTSPLRTAYRDLFP